MVEKVILALGTDVSTGMVNIKEVVSLLGQPAIHFAQSSHIYLSSISVNLRYILFLVLLLLENNA